MSKSPIKISNPFKDPLGFATQLVTAPIVLPAVAGVAAGKYVANKTMEQVGLKETAEEKAAREAGEAQTAEEAARAGAYNDALTDQGLDSITRNEISQMFASGANSGNIANYLQAARTGKGIFGVRTINEQQSKFQAANPGRSATLGMGSIL